MIAWLMLFAATLGALGVGLWVGVGIGYRVGQNSTIKALSERYTLIERSKPISKP